MKKLQIKPLASFEHDCCKKKAKKEASETRNVNKEKLTSMDADEMKPFSISFPLPPPRLPASLPSLFTLLPIAAQYFSDALNKCLLLRFQQIDVRPISNTKYLCCFEMCRPGIRKAHTTRSNGMKQ